VARHIGFSNKGFELLSKSLELHPAGFEPALPKETELKSVALDHSAKDAFLVWLSRHIGFSNKGFELLSKSLELHPAGFEPALPKETELKSVALDHSAKDAFLVWLSRHIGFSNKGI
jgi:DNA polymerase III sliding clamp (beta) subunit (PCNA family)